jgi:hypothetical protein
MCSDGWDLGRENVNGTCHKCGTDTVDGQAVEGCNWSPVLCEECGDAPCDLSC